MANTSNGYRGPENLRAPRPASWRQVCPQSRSFSLGYGYDTSGVSRHSLATQARPDPDPSDEDSAE